MKSQRGGDRREKILTEAEAIILKKGFSATSIEDILEKAHIGVTPGIDFGANGEGYLRFSYANSLDNLKIGMDRLEDYLKRYA